MGPSAAARRPAPPSAAGLPAASSAPRPSPSTPAPRIPTSVLREALRRRPVYAEAPESVRVRLLLPPEALAGQRSLRVAVVGAPNAGKSTLLNALLGEHVSAVSPKYHTTRDRVLGVWSDAPARVQLVFTDTPGFVPEAGPGSARFAAPLARAAREALPASDAVLLVVDAARRWEAEQEGALRDLAAACARLRLPLFLVANKVDLLRGAALTRAVGLLRAPRRRPAGAGVGVGEGEGEGEGAGAGAGADAGAEAAEGRAGQLWMSPEDMLARAPPGEGGGEDALARAPPGEGGGEPAAGDAGSRDADLSGDLGGAPAPGSLGLSSPAPAPPSAGPAPPLRDDPSPISHLSPAELADLLSDQAREADAAEAAAAAAEAAGGAGGEGAGGSGAGGGGGALGRRRRLENRVLAAKLELLREAFEAAAFEAGLIGPGGFEEPRLGEAQRPGAPPGGAPEPPQSAQASWAGASAGSAPGAPALWADISAGSAALDMGEEAGWEAAGAPGREAGGWEAAGARAPAAPRAPRAPAPAARGSRLAVPPSRVYALLPPVTPLAASLGEGVARLRDALCALAPPAPWEFSSRQVTDLSRLERLEEVIREKLFAHLHAEVPYRVQQANRSWRTNEAGELVVDQDLLVPSQAMRRMLTARAGGPVKAITREAIADLEAITGRRVHLFLHIAVKPPPAGGR